MCEHKNIRKNETIFKFCMIIESICLDCNKIIFKEQIGAKDNMNYYKKF